MQLKIILEPSEDGGYTAVVPSLPGCISEGETVEEAMRSIREAIELHLEPVAGGGGEGRFERQDHPEASPLAQLAGDADFSPVVVDDAVADCQPEARAFPLFLGGEEGIEDAS